MPKQHRSGAAAGTHISIARLWEKYGGICWLCGDYVDLEFDEPTRDHLIPFAQGGGGGWDNIRLAHRPCNMVRGNEPMTAREALLQNRALRRGLNQQI